MRGPDGSNRVLLVDHREGQCRAIVGFKNGDPGTAYMCGEPVMTGSRQKLSSWCAYHYSRMHVMPWSDGRSVVEGKQTR